MFTVIVAADLNNGIGKDNQLPWSLKGDMKYFKEVTSKVIFDWEINAVVMGRNTWLSIPEKFRPLQNRVNIVLSSDNNFISTLPEGVVGVKSLNEAIEYCHNTTRPKSIDQIFVIGGAQLYKEAFKHENCYEILLTRIKDKFDCDTFIPEIDKSFVLTSSKIQKENGIEYSFETHSRVACCL